MDDGDDTCMIEEGEVDKRSCTVGIGVSKSVFVSLILHVGSVGFCWKSTFTLLL